MDKPIWALDAEEACRQLETSKEGLSQEEADSRLKQYGYNELPEPPRRPLILRFTDQLTHLMALLLWVAGILAFVARIPQLGWAIWSVIWINAIFSFWQEYKAERALAELKKMLPTQTHVYRGGQLRVIPARELVPGDIIHLEEGDRISADARLISSEMFSVDVSPLTGESFPVARNPDRVRRNGLRLSDISNLVLAGTTVAAGDGIGVVFTTGADTEFGKVARLTAGVEREPSTLELQISRIVRIITFLAVGMGVAIFLLASVLIGIDPKESFIFAIGITVALVPEGLLPTVTLSLAISVQRMARKRALVRRLSVVETLSAATVICTDKTGTLTKNEMTVRSLWTGSTYAEVTGIGYNPEGKIRIPPSARFSQTDRRVKQLLASAALCSNAHLVSPDGAETWKIMGDPTEGALIVAARKAMLDLEWLHRNAPRLKEIPFDSRRKMMTVLLNWNLPEIWNARLPYMVITKGAPVELFQRCRHVLKDGLPQEITPEDREEMLAANDELAKLGLRVLGVAFREGGNELLELSEDSLEQNLVFLGLAAMLDPPRSRVKRAISQCKQAGIMVTMVTGDYGLTALAVARRIGLVKDSFTLLTGREMAELSDEKLLDILKHKSGLIFARIIPEQKLRLVQAYQSLGHIVAVTGDGVNDAPALRAANIGIAMGKSGTDVAREAADIVLADDNFATIVGAVEQGRAVYLNIRKFMTYILASNMAELIPFIAMVVLKIPPALGIMQILAIDLGTDMVPALALGAEAPESGIMERLPRPKNKPLLDTALLLRAYLFLGLIEAGASMAGFFFIWWVHGYWLPELRAVSPAILAHTAGVSVMGVYSLATTVTLVSIVACQDGNVFACRSENISIFKLGFFTNRLIWAGIAVEWGLILSVVYWPPLQRIFLTTPLPGANVLMLLVWPLLLLAAEEIRKILLRKAIKFRRG